LLFVAGLHIVLRYIADLAAGGLRAHTPTLLQVEPSGGKPFRQEKSPENPSGKPAALLGFVEMRSSSS
jgi:hypothetical protein